MPLNPLTGFFARVWKFVDQFQSDDAITRAGLDAALDDFTPSINAALTAKADALRIAGNVGLAFERLTDLQQPLIEACIAVGAVLAALFASRKRDKVKILELSTKP